MTAQLSLHRVCSGGYDLEANQIRAGNVLDE